MKKEILLCLKKILKKSDKPPHSKLQGIRPVEIESSENIRLHLGCGLDYWPNYVNVDNNPSVVCDLRLDFTRIPQYYPSDSISEITMIHSLSYLRLWQARDLLVGLNRLLQPRGRLIIELPDLAKCTQYALEKIGHDLPSYLEAVRGLYAFGMDQIELKEMFTPYAFGWSSWHLKYELEQIGFGKIVILDPQEHGSLTWRDTRIEAFK